MLSEIKEVLKEKLAKEMEGVSIYRARKENKKIGGIAINTIYDILKDNKNRLRNIHNNTILALLREFNMQCVLFRWSFIGCSIVHVQYMYMYMYMFYFPDKCQTVLRSSDLIVFVFNGYFELSS